MVYNKGMDYGIKYGKKNLNEEINSLVQALIKDESLEIAEGLQKFVASVEKAIKKEGGQEPARLHSSGNHIFALELNHDPKGKKSRVVVVGNPEAEMISTWNWLADFIDLLLKKRNVSIFGDINWFFVPSLCFQESLKNESALKSEKLRDYFLREEIEFSADTRVLLNFPVQYKDWEQPWDYPGPKTCESTKECVRDEPCGEIRSCKMMTQRTAAPSESAAALTYFLQEIQPQLVVVAEDFLVGGVGVAQLRWQPTVISSLQEAWEPYRGELPPERTAGVTIGKSIPRDLEAEGHDRDGILPRSLPKIVDSYELFQDKIKVETSDLQRYAGNVSISEYMSAELPSAQLVRVSVPVFTHPALGDRESVKVEASIRIEKSQRVHKDKKRVQLQTYGKVSVLGEEKEVLLEVAFEDPKMKAATGEQEINLTSDMLAVQTGEYCLQVLRRTKESWKKVLPHLNVDTPYEEKLDYVFRSAKEYYENLIYGHVLSHHGKNEIKKEDLFHYNVRARFEVVRVLACFLQVLRWQDADDKVVVNTTSEIEALFSETTRAFTDPMIKHCDPKTATALHVAVILLYTEDLVTGRAEVSFLEEKVLALAGHALTLKQTARKAKHLPNVSMVERRGLETQAEAAKKDLSLQQEVLNQKRDKLGLSPLVLVQQPRSNRFAMRPLQEPAEVSPQLTFESRPRPR